MKQLFLTLVFLFALLGGVSAQELTVKSMEAAPLDLSASTSPRLDLNKQPCALVKVQLPLVGAAFSGNVLGEVENRAGVYWVYMSQGSYKLQVRHQDFMPLEVNFRDYGIRGVEGKVTYVLTLQKPQTPQAPEEKKQMLIINYTPKDATVVIDSKLQKGNGRVEVELPLGEHSYMIVADGYITAEGTVKLNGGNQRVLNETLEREAVATTTPVASSTVPTTTAMPTPVTQMQEMTLTESAAATTATSGIDNGHEWVDLGLSVCWATTNVGASKPGNYGNYYAWGETTTKSEYNWSTYKHCKGSRNSMTKYYTQSDYGTVDNKTVLDAFDDVAHVKWGGNWRMPTYEELEELKEKCKWTWEKINNHQGYKVTGPNGNSIFLPAAGCRLDSSLNYGGSYGDYWSRTLSESYPANAWFLGFNSSDIGTNSLNRSNGRSVRPVRLSE